VKHHSESSGKAAATPAAEKGSSSEVLRDPGIPFAEFVAIIAMIMALNAMAIDVMLPALPAIGDALNIVEENNRQLVLLSYLIGFGGAQLFFGPVTGAASLSAVSHFTALPVSVRSSPWTSTRF
jgi:DHA1 family bicyclomycin/chloramphenicol resistance-like MFS transporter